METTEFFKAFRSDCKECTYFSHQFRYIDDTTLASGPCIVKMDIEDGILSVWLVADDQLPFQPHISYKVSVDHEDIFNWLRYHIQVIRRFSRS